MVMSKNHGSEFFCGTDRITMDSPQEEGTFPNYRNVDKNALNYLTDSIPPCLVLEEGHQSPTLYDVLRLGFP